MAIAEITICKWKADSKNDQRINYPDWIIVERAISALNNKEFNDLYLTPDSCDPETYLTVGGGSGRYLVTGSIRNERFPTVVDRTKPEDSTEALVVGGQIGDYPAQWVIDLTTAIAVTKHFYETNQFEGGGFDWLEA